MSIPESKQLPHFPLGNSLVVAQPQTGLLYVLNRTSGMIWQACMDGMSLEQIVNQIAGQFDAGPQQVRHDVESAIAGWRRQGLLEPRPDPIVPVIETALPRASGSAIHESAPFDQHYRLFDCVYRVRVHAVELLSWIHALIAHLQVPQSTSVRHQFDLYRRDDSYELARDGSICASSMNAAALVLQLQFEFMQSLHYGDDRIAVFHAANVSDGERCIVMPAPGGSGKSTLSAALMHAGLEYLSDDIVPLLRNNRVAPVPVSLGLKEGSWPVLGHHFTQLPELPEFVHRARKIRFLPPTRYRPELAFQDHRVHCLLFTQYLPETPLQLSRVSPEDALQRIVDTGAWLSQPYDDVKLSALIRWVEQVPAWAMTYSALPDAVLRARGLLDSP